MKTVVYIFHFEVQILGNFSQEACGVSKNALKVVDTHCARRRLSYDVIIISVVKE